MEKLLSLSVASYNVEKLVPKTLDTIIESGVIDSVEVLVGDQRRGAVVLVALTGPELDLGGRGATFDRRRALRRRARGEIEYGGRLEPAVLAARAAHRASLDSDRTVGNEVPRPALAAFEDHLNVSPARLPTDRVVRF